MVLLILPKVSHADASLGRAEILNPSTTYLLYHNNIADPVKHHAHQYREWDMYLGCCSTVSGTHLLHTQTAVAETAKGREKGKEDRQDGWTEGAKEGGGLFIYLFI